MKAGRELDKLILVALGLQVYNTHEEFWNAQLQRKLGFPYAEWHESQKCYAIFIKNHADYFHCTPSQDWNGAGWVVAQLNARGYTMTMEVYSGGDADVDIQFEQASWSAYAWSVPLAVTSAALKALGVEVPVDEPSNNSASQV